MRLTLRLITILCYFLPFTFFLTTCNGLELKIAYNQTEADKNILLQNQSETASSDTTQNDSQILNDTTKSISVRQSPLHDTSKITSDTPRKSTDYKDEILRKIVMPTDTSLSGIGSVFYFKNLTGQLAIAISVLISLILLAAFKFLKSQKAIKYLLLTMVLCLTTFILDSFISNVTLLWGTWALLALVLLQLFLTLKDKDKTCR